jgi:hypothetical protein
MGLNPWQLKKRIFPSIRASLEAFMYKDNLRKSAKSAGIFLY